MIYCFLQHISCFICASSLNLLAPYALCHVLCLDLHALCFMPCFVFRSTSLMLICLDLLDLYFMPSFTFRSTSFHAYMFRSTCSMLYAIFVLRSTSFMPLCLDLHAQHFYAMFPLFFSSLCFVLLLGLCAHMLDTMSMVMLCSDLCARMLFAMFYAQIHICTCLYA